MQENKALIQKFYTSFQNKDYKGMQECYASEAVFVDDVFQELDADKVKAMWQMLLMSSRDLQITFDNIHFDEHSASCDWVPVYTFSLTDNKVINSIHAEFEIQNGKFTVHHDSFNFYKWARQAFGIKGWLFGWMRSFQCAVQKKSQEKLSAFMVSKAD